MDAPVSEAEARAIIATWGELHDQGHKVTRFEYLPDFAPHDADDYDPHLDPTHRQRR